jgi:hypothetical protein
MAEHATGLRYPYEHRTDGKSSTFSWYHTVMRRDEKPIKTIVITVDYESRAPVHSISTTQLSIVTFSSTPTMYIL